MLKKVSTQICLQTLIQLLWNRMVRAFANGLGDQGLIPSRVILKTQKKKGHMLNTQHYMIRSKGKWTNPGKGVTPSSTLQCSSYWKGSFLVALDYCRPTQHTQIYICVCVCARACALVHKAYVTYVEELNIKNRN